jgi:isopenicillin-N N-acyltransferase-like protein
MKLFKVIEAQGTPYEIGFAHGSQGKEEVLVSISTYKKMFKTYANLDWEIAKKRSLAYVDYINSYDKDLMEEIKGVAAGAEVSLEDILALNARSEVIMMEGSKVSDGCTAMAITPESTKDGNTLLAQNWDWKQDQIASIIVLKIHQQHGKPDLTMVTEGGIIGKVGFNSAGIGVCLNALGTVGNPKGLPLHIVLRGILNSVKLSDAVERINMLPNACAANYLIASACGEALDVEKSPVDFEVIYPTNGILAHTNHFQTERLKAADTLRLWDPDTYLRYGIARKMLDKNAGKITINTIKEILKCHKDQPDSICRHEDPLEEEGKRICTVFSLIMDLTSHEMLILRGNPCENEYQKV